MWDEAHEQMQEWHDSIAKKISSISKKGGVDYSTPSFPICDLYVIQISNIFTYSNGIGFIVSNGDIMPFFCFMLHRTLFYQYGFFQ